MNCGELHAFHYATQRPVRMTWRDGIITALEEVAEPPSKEIWIAPPLVDLQINGYAGVDFQRDDVTVEELLHASRALRRDGCAHFLLTLITDDWPRLLALLKRFRDQRASSPELQATIIGWHIEGPFLSEEPGFHGAHRPELMCNPTPEHIHELRSITGDDRVLLTLAPERNGALEAITCATKHGILVSLGHTDASAETLREAVAAGATGFTHLANGCPRELDRHDNILWRVCETPGLTVSFIPDGHHVSPAPFRLLHKLLGDRSIYYTTDAMAAAGAGPGRYRLGPVEVEVGADQIVRQPGQTNFAGSALTPVEGVFRAAKMLNRPWQECWQRFSEAPARFIGFKNELRVGTKSFCVFDPENKVVTFSTSNER
jgi:N-acetylglucosamine-6-phosphate deacetylase